MVGMLKILELHTYPWSQIRTKSAWICTVLAIFVDLSGIREFNPTHPLRQLSKHGEHLFQFGRGQRRRFLLLLSMFRTRPTTITVVLSCWSAPSTRSFGLTTSWRYLICTCFNRGRSRSKSKIFLAWILFVNATTCLFNGNTKLTCHIMFVWPRWWLTLLVLSVMLSPSSRSGEVRLYL